jgi:PAS domain S-box-containing protein
MREASTHSRRSPSQLTSFQALEQSGAAVIAVDTAGQIQHWSHAASELYGWTQAEVQGRRLIELIGEQYPYAEDGV